MSETLEERIRRHAVTERDELIGYYSGDIVELLDKRDAAHAALIAAARELLQYRKQAGAINFQLEKADSYLHALAALIDREPQP